MTKISSDKAVLFIAETGKEPKYREMSEVTLTNLRYACERWFDANADRDTAAWRNVSRVHTYVIEMSEYWNSR